MPGPKVQGRVYRAEWAGCSCDQDLSVDRTRYTCAECGGKGTVDIDVLDDAAYARAKASNTWTRRCGHCVGTGWHP